MTQNIPSMDTPKKKKFRMFFMRYTAERAAAVPNLKKI